MPEDELERLLEEIGDGEGGGGSDISFATEPWLEDLMVHGIRYGVEPTLASAPEIIRKAAAAGDLGTALIVLQILMSNATSPPYHIFPYPLDTKVEDIVVLDEKKLDELGLDEKRLARRGASKMYVVLIYYRDRDGSIGVAGWRIAFKGGKIKWVSDPLTILELMEVDRRVRGEAATHGSPAPGSGASSVTEELLRRKRGSLEQ